VQAPPGKTPGESAYEPPSCHFSLESPCLLDSTLLFFKAMNSTTLEKSKKFAIRIYNLYRHLCDEKKEYTLAKQILRSGTSIGANLSEAQYSISKKEFLAKTSISLKECAETEYWLDLLKEINLISPIEYESIIKDCKDLLYLLISITKTTKQTLTSEKL
jgi:four helix bundle protein